MIRLYFLFFGQLTVRSCGRTPSGNRSETNSNVYFSAFVSINNFTPKMYVFFIVLYFYAPTSDTDSDRFRECSETRFTQTQQEQAHIILIVIAIATKQYIPGYLLILSLHPSCHQSPSAIKP
jgi:hypothetical protein